MMESKKEVMHTPEPWIIEPDPVYGRHFNITTAKRIEERITCITQVELHWDEPFESEQIANARRIVACVNACAGISTELLEQHGITAVLAPSESSKAMAEASLRLIQSNARQLQLTAQRDELLEALKALEKCASYMAHQCGYFQDEVQELVNARSAIAKCEVQS